MGPAGVEDVSEEEALLRNGKRGRGCRGHVDIAMRALNKYVCPGQALGCRERA